MRTRLALLTVVALLGIAGCNRGDDPAIDVDPGPITTTTAARSPATTGAGGSPATTSAAAKTPDAAADGLFASWKAGDRQGASRYASQRAVVEMFKRPYTGGAEFTDQGCTPQGGAFDCAWTYPGGALHMTVEDVPAGGYVVNLITYTAD